jgi:hypothetical protein
MSSKRLTEVFTVLRVIRRGVDETHEVAARAISNAAADRTLAEHLIGGTRGVHHRVDPTGLDALCRRLIDEREMLATKLEDIRAALADVNIRSRSAERMSLFLRDRAKAGRIARHVSRSTRQMLPADRLQECDEAVLVDSIMGAPIELEPLRVELHDFAADRHALSDRPSDPFGGEPHVIGTLARSVRTPHETPP